jgi:hypothetical protein
MSSYSQNICNYCIVSSTTGDTSGAGTTYRSGSSEFTAVYCGIHGGN